jgi:hypothetical protein
MNMKNGTHTHTHVHPRLHSLTSVLVLKTLCILVAVLLSHLELGLSEGGKNFQ